MLNNHHANGWHSTRSNSNSRGKRVKLYDEQGIVLQRKRMIRLALFSILLLGSYMFGAYVNVFANTNEIQTSNDAVFAQVDIGENIVNVSLEEIKTVDVSPGDTLWKIAQKHAPERVSVREYIKQIKEINGIADSVIHVDQLLYLP